jgi:hypothetical protein
METSQNSTCYDELLLQNLAQSDKTIGRRVFLRSSLMRNKLARFILATLFTQLNDEANSKISGALVHISSLTSKGGTNV